MSFPVVCKQGVTLVRHRFRFVRRGVVGVLVGLLLVVVPHVGPLGVEPAEAQTQPSGFPVPDVPPPQPPPQPPAQNAPAQPVGFALSSFVSGELVFSWDAVPALSGVTGYERRVGSGVPFSWSDWKPIDNSDVSTASTTVSGLSNGVEYRVQVRAVAGDVKGVASAVRSGVPSAAPTGVMAAAGDGQVTLSWDLLDNPRVTGFEYQNMFEGKWIPIPGSNASTTSHVVTGLTNGTVYWFWLRALEGSATGATASSFALRATPNAGAAATPAAPTNFRATRWFDRGFEVAWDNPNDASITGYQRRIRNVTTTQGWQDWVNVSGSSSSTTSAPVGSLVNGNVYEIQVRAMSGSTAGITSLVVRAVPNGPVALSSLSVGDRQVTLRWVTPSDTNIAEAIVGWEMRYNAGTSSIDGSGTWTRMPSSSASTTSHTVSGLTNDTNYGFRVRPVFTGGAIGNLSNQLQATPVAGQKAKPAAPRNFGISQLEYVAATEDDPATMTGVFYADDPMNAEITGYGWRSWKVSDPGTVNSLTDTVTQDSRLQEFEINSEYVVELRARIKISDGNFVEGEPATVRFTTFAVPTGLEAGARNGQVDLSWTDPEIDAVSWYEYRVGTGFLDNITWQEWNGVPNSNSDTTSHTVGGLTNDRLYRFQVRAHIPSQPPIISLMEPVSAAPSAWSSKPSGFGLSSFASGELVFSWNAPGDSSRIDGYERRVGSGVPFSWGAWEPIVGSDASTVSTTVSGLSDGVEYRVQVRAASAEYPFVVASDVRRGVPSAAPTGVMAAAGDGKVTLSWDRLDNPRVTGFQYLEISGGGWVPIPGSNASTTSHVVTGLTNGVSHRFKLRAVAGLATGEVASLSSAVTPVAGAATTPAAPSNLRTTRWFDRGFEVAWDNPNNASITGYQRRIRNVTTTQSWQDWTNVSGSSRATSATVSSLVNGNVYEIQVRAASGSTAGITSLAVRAVPNGPVTLSSLSVGDRQVTLKWTTPTSENVTDAIVGWEVRYNAGTSSIDGSGTWTLMPSSSASTTSHTVSGLTNGTNYGFKVRPVFTGGARGDQVRWRYVRDSVGQFRWVFTGGVIGNLSNQVQATPVAGQKAKPAAPRNFMIRNLQYIAATQDQPATMRGRFLADFPMNAEITGYGWRIWKVSDPGNVISDETFSQNRSIDFDINSEYVVELRARIENSDGTFVEG